jgi:DNA gyrase subunit B
VEKCAPEKIYQNAELQALISALGLGMQNGEFDKASLRYHRIVVMTDADVDGAHIRILLLTFFYRYQRALIEQGFVYIACPPLYKVTQGKSYEKYVFNQEELDALLPTLQGNSAADDKSAASSPAGGQTEAPEGERGAPEGESDRAWAPSGRRVPGTSALNGPGQAGGKKVTLQRFKGLGEMMPGQLWDTTMNPQTRRMRLVTVEDAAAADRVFTVLMGDAVGPRRDFITNNAASMTFGDIDV